MKLGKIFRRKRKDKRDNSKKDASNRGTAEDEEPIRSSVVANRGSSEFPSFAASSQNSVDRGETGSNGHRSVSQEAPPSRAANEDTHGSESEDVVSEMVAKSTGGGKRRINKGVPDSFKGLSVSHRFNVPQVEEDPEVVREISEAYDGIPEIEQIRLPRGGISIDTKAVGRIQFGIPPETIKDSMRLGIPVPQIYIVPAERFCREMGPALGVNLAEFEFPGYFNFFICKQKCMMIVDSQDAQDKICSVLSETLLGPGEFLGENPRTHNEEDFAPDFPRDAIPNFQKELEYFRKMPDGSELAVTAIYDFCHFKIPEHGSTHAELGVPPIKSSGDKKSEGRWFGDVATVWPLKATEEQKKERSVPRVEIFKMASGLEYIIHDIDENNHIIGRARFNGHIKVSEMMSVEGFSGSKAHDFTKKESTDEDDSVSSSEGFGSPMSSLGPPSFHPPSFGVTTLGNSHGFDKSGSTSGYVLWVNGRGIMIDPPPYSSATLEREGIRPRTIVGIILTHCHADHDAGAFQKVLTGSPVVVITTPTIYKSFIRKYAALASVSPALLRHCHRYKPAIVGEALRFQGANFRFQYSLHAIPCVGFRVDWRGRSMVFSGDHLNKPVQLDQMQKDGVLSKARGDDLRNLPLQETDLLLHEAGVPPLHTPLEELMKLPQRVRKRLYVVHTATIPEEFDLRVAPTGTAGTLRLDKVPNVSNSQQPIGGARRPRAARHSHMADDDLMAWGGTINEYEVDSEPPGNKEMSAQSMQYAMTTSFTGTNKKQIRHSITDMGHPTVPLVGMRPASSTDAWFILNLLSAVPFMSSLSYASTMEVLETARVEVFAAEEQIIEAERRRSILCVVWEGTCVEKPPSEMSLSGIPEGESDAENEQENDRKDKTTVWHAGDWTGPIALQPDKRLSGESERCMTHDIVALSTQGVKVITIDFSALHQILKSGSGLYRKYLDRQAQQNRRRSVETTVLNSNGKSDRQLTEALRNLNIVDLLDQNFALRKLSAVQKRHIESLAAGPISFEPGARLWRDGAPVDRAFMIVSGTASFVPKRRNAGSATARKDNDVSDFEEDEEFGRSMSNTSKESLSDKISQDALKVAEDFDSDEEGKELNDRHYVQLETLFSRSQNGMVKSMTEANDFADLSKNLQRRADAVSSGEFTTDEMKPYEWEKQAQAAEEEPDPKDRRSALQRKASVRARFENKVLGRIHSREAYTGGLVFSRGHFLGDISRMFYGHVNTDLNSSQSKLSPSSFDLSLDSMHDKVIQDDESESGPREGHTSTLIAGKEGCVVLVFEKASLIPFLDEYPGLLLSLLGTQVVV
ncbi:unnamed protein product [Cylindrotheca closterium]|uniref:Metallo-beta-lactamase domain-containing protein n=1 Tax=Cylindrotheca closterium TaxID=2856 RepID=A0AAD2CB05_9STRA|nr:unnamed protein product [Cylindrotheca closterium]